jgi:hypothetical protein
MHMVWHEMTLDNPALLLPGQCVEDRTQLSARLPENRFPPPFRHENYMVLAVPLAEAIYLAGKGREYSPQDPESPRPFKSVTTC